ncbi:MAG: acetate--CoA ligase family protein [Myxococcota bacterium]|jgi:acetyltransferase|nr:acetate--CoA ligase family protein [Myxococcota bacterium]
MLDFFFRPKVVAVMGVDGRRRCPAAEIVANLCRGGFEGLILPLGQGKECSGVEVAEDLAAHRGSLDLAVIASTPQRLLADLELALDARVRAVVVCTELTPGESNAALAVELASRCAQRGARLLGPSSLGIINTGHKLNASLLPGPLRPGSVAIVSQSNGVGAALLDAISGAASGVSTLVCLGDRADLTEGELLPAMAADTQTRVVACYLENIDAGERFVKSCEAVTQDKPLVILKSGVTELGAKTARLHLGRTAGADIAYAAAFKRAGVVRAEHFEELLDFCFVLSTQPLPAGQRIGLVTNAGGAAIMAADAVEDSGSTLSQDDESVKNPWDLEAGAEPERYAEAISQMLRSPSLDAVVVIHAPDHEVRPDEAAKAIAEVCRKSSKPVTAAFLGGSALAEARRLLEAAGIPAFCGPERAVRALRAVCEYSAWKRRPPRIVTRFPVNRRRVERILLRQQRTGHFDVGELQAKEVLAAYGFAVPQGQVCSTAEEAVEIAERIGFPVALKVISQDIVRKADYGGYKLHLSTPSDVRDAFDLMVLRILNKAPELRLEGVYVEKMCHGSQEVIVGMQHDPHFGPMLMFGVGGTYVETMEDVAFHLAPISAVEAMQMLRSTRSFSMLADRGDSGLNLPAIAEALQRVSQLATDFPQISRIDINPLIVGPAPAPAIAVDAEILLSRQEEP